EALSSDEIETILYVGTGLTDDAVGAKFSSEGKRSKHGVLSDRAIQARLRNVYIKLGIKDYDQNDGGIFNERCRAVWACLKNGIVTVEDFALKERELELGSAMRTALESK